METPNPTPSIGAKVKHAVAQALRLPTTPSASSTGMLRALQDRPLYAGTVDDAEVQRRRAANRRARKARRVTRRRG